jgi:hypothetical protein
MGEEDEEFSEPRVSVLQDEQILDIGHTTM